MKATEKLDLKLQAAVLELGQAISESKGTSHRLSQRQPSAGPDASANEAERVLKLVRASPANKLFGITKNLVDGEDTVRLKAVAFVAWRMIGEATSVGVNEAARAVVDGKGVPGEQLLLARDCLARMVCEGLLVIKANCGDYWDGKLFLPKVCRSWMAGGEKGKGDFAINKIDQCRYGRKGERDGDGGTGIRGKVPTAKELFEKVRQEVVGLDPQIRVLASRIALHAARAEILRASTDDCAVGQMVVVLVGSSGAGKSFVASRLAAHCGLGFCQYDSTVLTSQGYVGADLDEPYRLLVNSVGGDAKEASRGIILFDEFDKKSTRYGRDVCTQSIQQELLGKLQTASPFVIGGKRSSDILPFLFDGRRTGYFLAGVFSGLDEVIRKKAGRSGIGFASEGGSRRHVYVQDALRDFGYLDELVNRVSCVVRLPDPTVSNLEQAIAGTIEDGFSQILLTKGIALHLGDSAVRLIARYAAGTKTFYRGARQVLGVIAEELMFDPKPTAYLIGKADVRRAIERLSSGIVQPDDGGGAGRPVERNGLASPDADQDATPESELAGG